MKQLFDDEDHVKIKDQADWKYRNLRSGTNGVVNDIYYSEKYGSFVYEVAFGEAGYVLIYQEDLDKA